MDIEKTFSVRLEARLKNDMLVKAREQLKISALNASKQIGIGYTTYIEIELMHHYPQKGTQRKIIKFYNDRRVFMLHEDVFPEELKKVKPKKLIAERDIPAEDLVYLSEPTARHIEYRTTPEDEIMKKMSTETLNDLLRSLKPREEEVIRMKYGIEPYGEHTQLEIAEKLNLSGTRIGQIEHAAMWKLKNPVRKKKLVSYLE